MLVTTGLREALRVHVGRDISEVKNDFFREPAHLVLVFVLFSYYDSQVEASGGCRKE